MVTITAHSPSSSVFSFVQLVLSFTFLKCGCFSLRPVSNTATFTPVPSRAHTENTQLVPTRHKNQRGATRWPATGGATDLCVPSAREHLPGGSGPRGEGWPAADACWSGGLSRARSRSPATSWSVGTAGTTARTAISGPRVWCCKARKAQVLRSQESM